MSSNPHNLTKSAERSIEAFEHLMEQCRLYGYEIIKDIILRNNPSDSNMIVDPILVVKHIFDKIEHEYLKRHFQRGGKHNEYIITTDDTAAKHRRSS